MATLQNANLDRTIYLLTGQHSQTGVVCARLSRINFLNIYCCYTAEKKISMPLLERRTDPLFQLGRTKGRNSNSTFNSPHSYKFRLTQLPLFK